MEVIIEGPVHRLYFFLKFLRTKKKKKIQETNKQTNKATGMVLVHQLLLVAEDL